MISEAEGELPLFDVPNDTLSHNVSFKILSFDEVRENSVEYNLTKDDLAVLRDIQWLNWRYNNHPYIKYIYIGCSIFLVHPLRLLGLKATETYYLYELLICSEVWEHFRNYMKLF